MVLFDSDYLSFLFHANPGAVIEPKTKRPVKRVKEKIEHLLDTLNKNGEKIVIPTPVLAEVLSLCTDRVNEVFTRITSLYSFELVAFDVMAAIEAALSFNIAKNRGHKRGGSSKSWQKIKFDRQIVAIAKVRRVTAIYSNDEHIRKLGLADNIKVIPVWELPDPPLEQTELLNANGNAREDPAV